jgi:hypothetical protein
VFIEAGAFFFEEDLDEALAAWDVTVSYSESRWANLVSRSLVKEIHDDDDPYDENHFGEKNCITRRRVWVHEQL